MAGSLRRRLPRETISLNPRDLIRIARHLATGGVSGPQGRPRQAELRRAVSAAYYAMFHALALSCANTLVGAARASRDQTAWRQTYRSLEHGYARRQCDDISAMRRFSAEVRRFGRTFADMQRQRTHADYDPGARFFRSHVLGFIDEAEIAIDLFEAVPTAARRPFSVHVLLRPRGG